MRLRKGHSGFSTLEIIVVIHIVAVLAALLYPVMASARREAKITRSMSQMRQIGVALTLYRADLGDEGPLGFGLPPSSVHLRRAQNLSPDLVHTGGNPIPGVATDIYAWFPPTLPASEKAMRDWNAYRMGNENPFLLFDVTQNASPNALNDAFDSRLVLAMRLDASVVRRRMSGVLLTYNTWKDQR